MYSFVTCNWLSDKAKECTLIPEYQSGELL